MKLKLKLSLLLAFLIFPPVSPRAQTSSQLQSWLTSVDRTALFARQAALPFSESKPQLITIDVNDQQRFQPSEDVRYRGRAVTVSLPAESVGTYIW